jgi:transposase InsO family protein
LFQKLGGVEKVITYYSRQLSDTENVYSTTDKELLALVSCIKKFRPHLVGREFEAYVDHMPLKYLFTAKDLSSRLARYALFLQEHPFKIVHTPGVMHKNADALSRIPINALQSPEYEPVWTRHRIVMEQKDDPKILKILQKIKTDSEYQKIFSIDEDEILYRNRTSNTDNDQLMVPESMKRKILKSYHDLPYAAHGGIARTYGLIKNLFYWNGMYTDIKNYIESCLSCNSKKVGSNRKVAPLQKYVHPDGVWHMAHIDVCGPFTTTYNNNKYILTYIDGFSKWVEAFPMQDQRTSTIAKILVKEIICRHGVPTRLCSDRGAPFLSEIMKNICEYLGIKKLNTSAFHSQGNANIERVHQSIVNILCHLVVDDIRTWDEQLNYCLLALRSSIHSSTKNSLYYLMHFRDMNLPFDTILKPTRQYYNTEDDYCQEMRMRMHKALGMKQSHHIY